MQEEVHEKKSFSSCQLLNRAELGSVGQSLIVLIAQGLLIGKLNVVNVVLVSIKIPQKSLGRPTTS
jgi:hypothetical protein